MSFKLLGGGGEVVAPPLLLSLNLPFLTTVNKIYLSFHFRGIRTASFRLRGAATGLKFLWHKLNLCIDRALKLCLSIKGNSVCMPVQKISELLFLLKLSYLELSFARRHYTTIVYYTMHSLE